MDRKTKREVIATLLRAGRRDLATVVAKADVREKLMQFFRDNPNPKDSQVHELAESLGISPHDLETHIYAILTDLLQKR